ncbi:MAG: rhomboid family intramembrane serine protease [Bacteroides sp.]|nr:rhomboid family intramembrane serine protease [Bacteroides sp.]
MVTWIIIGLTVVCSYMCFNNRRLFEKLAFIPYLIKRDGEWYRFISYGFVHADTMHLFVNMFTFWSFGSYMEKIFQVYGMGRISFIILYFGGMIVASVYDLVSKSNNPYYISIGASGAVSAVLFASIVFNPWAKILLFAVVPIPGILFAALYLLYCQYMARRGGDNVNHNAHFYGAVFGFVFPILLRPVLLQNFI